MGHSGLWVRTLNNGLSLGDKTFQFILHATNKKWDTTHSTNVHATYLEYKNEYYIHLYDRCKILAT